MAVETTGPALTQNERNRFVDGYKIMGGSLPDIVRLCFQGDASMLPRLQKHIEQNQDEFQEYLEAKDQVFDAMVEKLQEFEKTEGHQHIKETQDRVLSWWVTYQKYLLDRLKLPAKDEEKLLKIRFDFRDNKDWDSNLHARTFEGQLSLL